MADFVKAKRGQSKNKGFTLAELIVVLVILAILAAMMVPTLLGWIDEARNKKYVLEARSVYVATQAVLDEMYGTGYDGDILEMMTALNTYGVEKIKNLSDVEIGYFWLHELNGIVFGETTDDDRVDSMSLRDRYRIQTMTFQFVSKDEKVIEAALTEDGTWEIEIDPEMAW